MSSQIINKGLTFQIIKKFTKTIISFSIFTFFLSNPSWLYLFLQSFISHISSFPSQILSHINDKNWIFLLFNGILVIILRKSSSSRKKTEIFDSSQVHEQVTSTNQMQTSSKAEEQREVPELGKVELLEKKLEDEEKELLVEEGKNGSKYGDEESTENCIEVEKDEGEERSVERMSTEELNRKFEEFIRRMKEEISTEAHQQLIMV